MQAQLACLNPNSVFKLFPIHLAWTHLVLLGVILTRMRSKMAMGCSAVEEWMSLLEAVNPKFDGVPALLASHQGVVNFVVETQSLKEWTLDTLVPEDSRAKRRVPL